MSDELEFVGRMNPKPLKSIEQEFKEERARIIADQKRFAKYGTNNPKLAALMESGQVMPAAELVRVREKEERRASAFEETVKSEQSLSSSRIPREKVKHVVAFSREPVDE